MEKKNRTEEPEIVKMQQDKASLFLPDIAVGDHVRSRVLQELESLAGKPVPEEREMTFCTYVSTDLTKQPPFDQALFLVVRGFPVIMAEYLGSTKLVKALRDAGYRGKPVETLHFYLARKFMDQFYIEHRLEMLNAEYELLFRPFSGKSGEKGWSRWIKAALKEILEELYQDYPTESSSKPVLFEEIMNKNLNFSRFAFDHRYINDTDVNGTIRGLLFEKKFNSRMIEPVRRLQIILRELCDQHDTACRVSTDFFWEIRREGSFLWLSKNEPIPDDEGRREVDQLLPLYLEIIKKGLGYLSPDRWSEITRNAMEDTSEKEGYLCREMLAKYPGTGRILNSSNGRELAEFFASSELSRSVFMFMCISTRQEIGEVDFSDSADPWFEEKPFLAPYQIDNHWHREIMEQWEITEGWLISKVWARRALIAFSYNMSRHLMPEAWSFVQKLAKVLDRPIMFRAEKEEDMELLEEVIREPTFCFDPWSPGSCQWLGNWCKGVEGYHDRENVGRSIVQYGEPEVLMFALKKNLIPKPLILKIADWAATCGMAGKVPYLLSVLE